MQASILAFMVLGVVLWLSLGSFQPLLVLVLGAVIGALAAGSVGGRAAHIGEDIGPDRLLACATLLGALLLALQPQLIYAEVPDPYYALRAVLGAIALLAAAATALVWLDRAPGLVPTLLQLAVAGLLVVRVLVPFASPQPVIDVFVNNTLGVDHLLAGDNPYRMQYPDVYHGAYGFVPALGYPPGALLLLVPFRALADVRLASGFADAVTVVLLLVVMRRAGHSDRTGWLSAVAWLAFPASLFVFEQAWLDPLLVPFLLGLVLAIEDRRWILAGVLLGSMIGIKQYCVLLSLGTAVYAFRVGGRRALRQGITAAAIVLVVLIVPFAIGDFASFYDQVAGTFLRRGFRRDSLSLAALVANAIGHDMPGALLAAVTALGVVGFAVWLARRRRPNEHDWVSAILLSFATALLFGKQAACNYYYLLAAMLLARAALAPMPSRRRSDRLPA